MPLQPAPVLRTGRSQEGAVGDRGGPPDRRTLCHRAHDQRLIGRWPAGGEAAEKPVDCRRSRKLDARRTRPAVAPRRNRQSDRLHADALAAFTRFLDDGRICLTNNAAERALRGIALGRRAWLFAGSDRGGERAAAMYTLIATAKLNDINSAGLARRRARPHRRPSRLPPPRAFALALESNPKSSRRGLITSPPRSSADAYLLRRTADPASVREIVSREPRFVSDFRDELKCLEQKDALWVTLASSALRCSFGDVSTAGRTRTAKSAVSSPASGKGVR